MPWAGTAPIPRNAQGWNSAQNATHHVGWLAAAYLEQRPAGGGEDDHGQEGCRRTAHTGNGRACVRHLGRRAVAAVTANEGQASSEAGASGLACFLALSAQQGLDLDFSVVAVVDVVVVVIVVTVFLTHGCIFSFFF